MNLEKLYKMQEELDKYIIKNRNIVMSDEELLNKTILALLVEVGELANATRCFKHWSLKGPENKERLLDELADVWHFYLSIGNQLNIRMVNIASNWNINKLTTMFNELYISISKIAITPYKWEGTIDAYKEVVEFLILISGNLGFTDKEVEQAYLKKHEENYRRQREGY